MRRAHALLIALSVSACDGELVSAHGSGADDSAARLETRAHRSTGALSNDLLEFTMDVAEGIVPSNRSYTDALLQAYRDRSPRPISEPQYISDLSFVWLLLKDELTAESYLKTSFCEAYLTRLSYLLSEGEIFSASPPGADSPEEIFAAAQSGTWSPLFAGRTANNRHGREAAALAIASLVLTDASESGVAGCFGVNLANLFAEASPLEAARVSAINQLVAPTGNTNINKYTPLTNDGAYKEGAGYLNFTNEVLMPMVFFHHHYNGGINLFEVPGPDYTAALPERLRGAFRWLYASQDDDGRWPPIEDAAAITNGQSFAMSIGVYMMRHLSTTRPNLRKNYCGMLGRLNQFLYPNDLRDACVDRAGPFSKCGDDQHVRLARLLFGPSAVDGYGITAPPSCGAYYRQGTAQYRKGPAVGYFPAGGHTFLRSNDANALQVRMFNAGSWFEPGGDDYNGYTSGGTSFSTHEACDSVFIPVGGAENRDCHLAVHLRTWFSTNDKPLDWHPRWANHKRYNDSHFELRAFGKDLLIGPGKMGYTNDPTFYPYEEWNSPASYNLTRTLRRWPKSLYLQGEDLDEKMQHVDSIAGCADLYQMRTDTYDRYILWAHERYLVVTDRVRAASPVWMQASFNVRGQQTYRNTPQGRLNTIYSYLDQTTTGLELNRDDNTRLAIRSVIGGLVDSEDVARDSCQDDEFELHADEGFCEHPVLRVATEGSRPQHMLSFVVWPYQGSDSPSISFSNVVMSGDTVKSSDVHILGMGVDDTWTVDADNLDHMLATGVCGP